MEETGKTCGTRIRDGDASSAETFSPTTPLAVVKMLVGLSLLHDVAIASLDVGDDFLQVPQTSTVSPRSLHGHYNIENVQQENVFGFCSDVCQVNVWQPLNGTNFH